MKLLRVFEGKSLPKRLWLFPVDGWSTFAGHRDPKFDTCGRDFRVLRIRDLL